MVCRRVRYNLLSANARRSGSLKMRSASLPRIADNLLDVSIYLYPSPHDAQTGENIGGSGFLVSLPAENEPGRSWVIAVTNRHVIEHGNPVVRTNSKDGKTYYYDFAETDWVFHKDQDLAACPIRVNETNQKYALIGKDSIMTREKAKEWELGPGDDTFLVGRFIHRDGGQTNVPTVRFGHIAQMPSIVEDPDSGRRNESFLIETRSIGGYSGSPVLVHKQPFDWRPSRKDVDTKYWGPALLGVDWGHSAQTEFVHDGGGRETQMYVHANTGLSLVIPGWRLLELLDSPEMAAGITDMIKGKGRGIHF